MEELPRYQNGQSLSAIQPPLKPRGNARRFASGPLASGLKATPTPEGAMEGLRATDLHNLGPRRKVGILIRIAERSQRISIFYIGLTGILY
jgi:hypothetical protein